MPAETSDFDFKKREVNLWMKKRKRNNVVTLSDRMLFEISEYLRNWQIKEWLFDLTQQRAWQLIKKYSRIAEISEYTDPLRRWTPLRDRVYTE